MRGNGGAALLRRDMTMRLRKLFGSMLVCAAALACGACNFFLDADARVARATERVAAGDYQGAAIELRAAVQDEPEHVRARLMLADISFRQGDVAAADQELRRALQSGAKPADTGELAARIGLALGRPQEVLVQIDSGELPIAEPLRSLFRGQALLAQQQAAAAIDAFGGALQQDPSLHAARTGLAEALASRGRTQEALAALDQVLRSDSGNAEALLTKGRILAALGRLAEAQELLTTADKSVASLSISQRVQLLSILTETQLARGDVAVASATQQRLAAVAENALITRILAARIAMAKQEYSTASAELQRIVAALPDVTSARFLLGVAQLAQNNLYQAESQLARVVRETPENLEARKLLAQIRLRLHQPDAAMQVLMPAQQADETDPQVNALLGMARLQLGDAAGAVAYLERGVAAKPDDRQAQLNLAATYLRTGDNQKAVTLLRSMPYQAGDARREGLLIAAVGVAQGIAAATEEVNGLLRAHAGDAQILNVCSIFFAQRSEFDRARALLAQARAAQPKEIATFLNAARVELAAGSPAAASSQLESALAVDPDNTTVRLALAELAVRKGDRAAAARRLEEVRKIDARALEPRLILARLYLQDRRTKEADELVGEVLAIAAQRPDVLNAIGLLYLDAGRYDQALSRFQAAADLDGRNAAYWLNLARAQLALDRRGLARESLERARAARPDSTAVVGALVLLDIREGKRDAAIARVAQLRGERPKDPGVLVLEGDVYMTLKEYAQADRAYQKAAELRLDAVTALKSYRARSVGKLGGATEPLLAWLAQRPDDFVAQAVLAEAYQRSDQRQRAIEIYELIVRNGPPSAAVLNNLAWLYQQTGDARAEATARKAYRMEPKLPAVADTYGWLLVENGKVSEGLPILKSAAEAAAGEPDIAFHYASALARSGEGAAARERLSRLLNAHSTFTTRQQAQRLLAELSQ